MLKGKTALLMLLKYVLKQSLQGFLGHSFLSHSEILPVFPQSSLSSQSRLNSHPEGKEEKVVEGQNSFVNVVKVRTGTDPPPGTESP